MTRAIIPTIIVIVLLIGFSLMCIEWTVGTVTVKVTDLQSQQLVSGSKDNLSTKIRYLVITDSETFVIENNYLMFKFNNSDIYYRLKKDSTYTFKASGIGKTLLTDYRNILKIK